MRGIILGILASLLSAATALIVANTGTHGVNPMWLLLAQYIVGSLMAPPRRLPVVSIKWHFLRLVAGLWAFGGYYAALSLPHSRPAEISMLLNVAPVIATFFVSSRLQSRLGAVLAFIGVALALSANSTSATFSLGYFSTAHVLAFTAALAYAASIVLLGYLAKAGERPATTNSIYNLSAGICILLALLITRPSAPLSLLPVLSVGILAAIRIQVLTVAAVSPAESAKVSVLSNLAFVWLAIAAAVQGEHQGILQGIAIVTVMIGVVIASKSRSVFVWPRARNSCC